MTPEEPLEKHQASDPECEGCLKPGNGVGVFYGRLFCEECLQIYEDMEEQNRLEREARSSSPESPNSTMTDEDEDGLDPTRPREGECVYCRKPGVGMFYGNLFCEHCLQMNKDLEELEEREKLEKKSGKLWYFYYYKDFIDHELPEHFVLAYCPECEIHCGLNCQQDFNYCPFCRGLIFNPEFAAEFKARRDAKRAARKKRRRT